MNLHPFEAMWRVYRKQIGQHLEILEKNIFKGMKEDEDDMANEIHHPFWRVERELNSFFRSIKQAVKDRDIFAMASLYHILLTWRNDKNIYKIEPKLYESLEKAKLPEMTPFSCIRLPRRSVLIDIPNKPYIFCYYDCVGLDDIADISSSELFLVIAEITLLNQDHPKIELWNIDANCNDLNQYLQMRKKNVDLDAPPHIEDEQKYQMQFKKFINPVLNVLAYINGDDDIIKVIHPGSKPVKNNMIEDKKRRLQDICNPEEYIVGKRFTSVIERWEEKVENKTVESNIFHSSPRPHIRSAHSHLYWTGEGRKEPKVKFLPPIPVLGGIVGEPEFPNVKNVK